MRLGIVVNSPGLQVRRAHAMAAGLPPDFEPEVLVAPSARQSMARARTWDAAYVIDPGRHGLPAAVAARLRGRCAVVEVGDPQAALYRSQGRSAVARAIGSGADGTVALGASGVVVRGRELAKTLRLRVPWTFIPDGVDVDRFRPLPVDAIRTRLGIRPALLVAGLAGTIKWSGPLQSAYGLDLIEALALAKRAPVHGLIVGGGDGVPRLRARAEELGITDRVTFTGQRPHNEVPGLLNVCDVCISTQSNDAVGRGRTTAKLPEYLACDRYVLATDVGTAHALLPREMLLPYSATVDRDHPRRLAERLITLSQQRDGVRLGAGTRRLALEHFDYRVLATHLSAFVRHLR